MLNNGDSYFIYAETVDDPEPIADEAKNENVHQHASRNWIMIM